MVRSSKTTLAFGATIRPMRQQIPSRCRVRGFTLIELLIAIAIVAILASIAYPSFMESVRKSRRADAVEAMTRIQQAQERWRANNAAYTGNLGDTGLKVSSDVAKLISAKGYYKVTVVPAPGAEGSGYVITAVAQGAQELDTKCLSMTMTMAVGQLTYDSTSGQSCWAK